MNYQMTINEDDGDIHIKGHKKDIKELFGVICSQVDSMHPIK